MQFKACPFCESTNTAFEIKTSKGEKGVTKFTFYVRCKDCHARGSTFKCDERIDFTERNKAYNAWNNAKRGEAK